MESSFTHVNCECDIDKETPIFSCNNHCIPMLNIIESYIKHSLSIQMIWLTQTSRKKIKCCTPSIICSSCRHPDGHEKRIIDLIPHKISGPFDQNGGIPSDPDMAKKSDPGG